jgi:hypothetical protein
MRNDQVRFPAVAAGGGITAEGNPLGAIPSGPGDPEGRDGQAIGRRAGVLNFP